MVSLTTIPCLTLLLICSASSSADQIRVPAEPGLNVTLPCRAADSTAIAAVEWIRTDLGSENVLLYKDGRTDPGNQHPSYRNRVDLQDRQMKDGDVSLVLKNVTTNDTGTYQCQVQNEGSLDIKLISSIHLEVLPPGNKDGGNQDGSVGLIVGLILVIVAVGAGVLFLLCKTQPACLRKKTPGPPADL